ncbi:MAG: bifunctional folylpolyglutamate synthase/dihydrofolate synthase [Chloroflexi bacterium]|nr:bifunctional folylpolyglutamate synthase/dihydrofolate synthase [Chloroflexota bacterium]
MISSTTSRAPQFIVSYADALNFLYAHANYDHRRGPEYATDVAKLAKFRTMLRYLSNPEETFPSLLIAGTKGKGSTAAMLATILQVGGYRVGLYTQPHLHSYRERVQINRELISQENLIRLAEQLQPLSRHMEAETEYGSPTTFELGTALAFLAFAQHQVDIAVVEVGIGGRLDVTNVLNPLISVITSISLDHTNVLGTTIPQIAWEKAGIIKPHGRVVSSPQVSAAQEVIQRVGTERQAEIRLAGRDLLWRVLDKHPTLTGQHLALYQPQQEDALEISSRLLGQHQQANITVAALAALWLREFAPVSVSPETVKTGLALTRWPGRFEVVAGQPPVVIDGAHNGDSAFRLRQSLVDYFPNQPITLVLGFSSDKEIGAFLDALVPACRDIILTRSRHPRATSIENLQKYVAKFGLSTHLSHDVAQGMALARQICAPEGVVCATGSLFVAAEAREAAGLAEEVDEIRS